MSHHPGSISLCGLICIKIWQRPTLSGRRSTVPTSAHTRSCDRRKRMREAVSCCFCWYGQKPSDGTHALLKSTDSPTRPRPYGRKQVSTRTEPCWPGFGHWPFFLSLPPLLFLPLNSCSIEGIRAWRNGLQECLRVIGVRSLWLGKIDRRHTWENLVNTRASFPILIDPDLNPFP